MITNYGTLKSSILATIGRAPAEEVYQFVTAELNRDLRVREMTATTTVTAAASVTLPSDALAIVSVYRDDDPRGYLTSVDSNAINRAYQSSGYPTKYAFVDEAGTPTLLLDSPGQGGNLVVRYFQELAEFSADSDTNDVLSEHPSIYYYGALAHHAVGIGDPRGQTWATAYATALERANQSAAKMAAPYSVVPPGMTP